MTRRRRLETRAGAAVALGIPPRALDRLLERGAPPPKAGPRGSKRYDVAAIAKWRDERQARIKPALDLAVERAKLARAQRQKLGLEMRVRRGALVSRHDAEELWRGHVLRARARLLQIPAQARVRGVPPAAVAIVDELIRGALEALSSEPAEASEATA